MDRDLVVFSHLRWTDVWQRPQHLISRLGRGRTVWFVEEPFPVERRGMELRTEIQPDGVNRVWLEVSTQVGYTGFRPDVAAVYRRELPKLLGSSDERLTWLYTPMALDVATSLEPAAVVFDVMDDLASFLQAPTELVELHRRALDRAEVVFAGGRSLHRGVAGQRPDAHLFASGVEPEHFERARSHRGWRGTPVAGYVGVIDERVDLGLLDGLAQALPDWEIRIVGPVKKIDPGSLPVRANLHFPGPQPYGRLPEVLGGFDVALMPFAINEATRSISPTKTLEYLAAGLPVVSTHVPDVVAEFESVVDLRSDAGGFARACRHVLGHDLSDRDRKLKPLLDARRWDTIAMEMEQIIDHQLSTVALEVTA